jgi:hypothetical protein
MPADEVAEARLVGAWIASHEPPVLELGQDLDGDRVIGWVRSVLSRA